MIKKLISHAEEEKKRKKEQKILGIVLILIMVVSVFAVFANEFLSSKNPEEVLKINYNGLNFVKENDLYKLDFGGENIFYFSTSPLEFENIDYAISLEDDFVNFTGAPLYLDSDSIASSQEFTRNFYPYVERMQDACYNESNCSYESLPLKTCEDNLIIIKESSRNNIYRKDNCIFIEGNEADLLALSDITMLRLLGVH